MTFPQGGRWVRPRVEETVAHTTGAIADVFTIEDSASMVALHINCSVIPASETMVVVLKNASGTNVRTWSFDPTEEYPGDNEITMVFEKWTNVKGGGTLNFSFDNTGDVVTSVVASWEYDGK